MPFTLNFTPETVNIKDMINRPSLFLLTLICVM